MRRVVGLLVAVVVAAPTGLGAQEHLHGPASGIPNGIPQLCAGPDVASVGSGNWSDAATWSTRAVPAAGARVRIAPGTSVRYDLASDAAIDCVNVEGTLAFLTDRATRIRVGTIAVVEGGALEVGTPARPVAPDVTAEIVWTDRPIDTAADPEQLGHGLVGLGRVTVAGAAKSPTFVRLGAEPLAGHMRLELEEAPDGWRAGDRLVLPDTRQLRQNERGGAYRPQWEELTIAAVDGRTVTLTAPLAFDHRGARDAGGMLEALPHVGNVTRNVVFRSENASGTRGHAIFVQHPEVDIRYALFKDMGRTRIGVLDSTEFDRDGALRRVGTNQIGRYSIHFHHAFGPENPSADGYQFTLIGNAVDGASKWGITVHNSHYGLVRENVVYDAPGAAIVTEDGSESFNVFERNFAMRSVGSGDFAPRSGYGGATADPGGEGAGFWLRGPNNILRGNVAANVDVFGYGMAAGTLGAVRVPRFRGADTTRDDAFVLLDTTGAPLLEFTGNEAYGAMQTGVAIGWNGTLADTRVWHASRHGIAAFPTDRLEIDGLIVRGDRAALAGPFENPTGIWFTNYAGKTVTVRRADVQGLRVGVASPFFARVDTEPGRGDGVATIEDSYFRNYVGVAVATAYTPPTTTVPIKKAVVRNSRFDPLNVPAAAQYAPAAISMNYGTAAGDTAPRDPILVHDFNGARGDTFQVFYSNELPASAAPACHEPRSGIVGFVCPGDGALQDTRR